MNQTCIMNKFATLALLFMATASAGWSQCTADFDFGDLTLGVSPPILKLANLLRQDSLGNPTKTCFTCCCR